MGLALLVHGGPGTGKSTLASSAPGPRLLMDTEAGGEYIAGKVITWTDLGKIPAGLDADTTVIVNIVGDQSLAIFQSLYQWLVSGKHPFKSVIVDSVTALQKRVIDKLTPIGGGDPDWMTIARVFERMIRELKDLKIHPVNPVEAVIFICETEQKITDKVQGPYQPALVGKMGHSIAHIPDVCGFTTLVVDKDGNVSQNLQIVPFNNVIAKDRTSPPGRVGLSSTFGHTLVNPNIPAMLQVLNQTQPVA